MDQNEVVHTPYVVYTSYALLTRKQVLEIKGLLSKLPYGEVASIMDYLREPTIVDVEEVIPVEEEINDD